MRERDYYARWSYEQLIVRQSHIEYDGLWREGDYYFIVCPSLETALTDSGEALAGWFHSKCRTAGSSVRLVAEPPTRAQRLAERSALDAAVLAGSPRTARDLFVELCLLLFAARQK